MAKMGRPKVDNPADKRVTVRFTQEEYNLLIEYAANQKMNVAQAVKYCIKLQTLKKPE